MHEVAKFGLVGSARHGRRPADLQLAGVRQPVGGRAAPVDGMLHDRPVTAKFISVTVATVATYLGNRHWTWRHRERTGLHREYVLFFVLNGIGLLIAAGCLGFSRYVLDLHNALADNIAANVVGLGLGTLFRFWSYRKWVFREEIALDEAEPPEGPGLPRPPSTPNPPATSPPSADLSAAVVVVRAEEGFGVGLLGGRRRCGARAGPRRRGCRHRACPRGRRRAGRTSAGACARRAARPAGSPGRARRRTRSAACRSRASGRSGRARRTRR